MRCAAACAARNGAGAGQTGALGLQLHVLHASREDDFDTVFATLAQRRAGALIIAPDNFFTARSKQLAALSLRHAVPAIYQFGEFAAAGGLMSYGSSETEYYRLVGIYAGKVLKGEKRPIFRSNSPQKLS